MGFAKLYDRKTALTAADLLNDRVIPFFGEHGLRVDRVLTDRGTEFCGAHDRHEYEVSREQRGMPLESGRFRAAEVFVFARARSGAAENLANPRSC